MIYPLDEETCLPRFNMPLELGVFLGAKRYEKNQKRKSCLLDKLTSLSGNLILPGKNLTTITPKKLFCARLAESYIKAYTNSKRRYQTFQAVE